VEKLAKDSVTIVFLLRQIKRTGINAFLPEQKVKMTTKFNFFKSCFDKSDFAVRKHLLRKCLI
jgi:hypothetical protein